ncbi:conjugative transposon protein TraN [Prevotella nigrescens]|uniref:conjugative transposon protein TraN n=1 Tax=Prevotella nigrescens TaxID=28133 RepID=UPI001C5FEE34|nr:conjugative transposon protein TraN [Prevotella nigrescens]MBW4727274.1 conjugative transposon protein TraN [Prevotella nigrescens]
MKKLILSVMLLASAMGTAFAQETDSNVALNPNSPLTSGELFQGMSRAIPNGRVVLPYGLDVTFDKTVHLIFPAPIRYVDLGSNNLIAGKAEDAENVLRVKAAVKDFETETNMSVICEDGSFYAFNVKYADEPEKLSVEMKDFLSTTEGRLPSNRADIYFKELGNESPVLVKLMMQTIYQNNRRTVKHIGTQQFGMRFLLRGLYAHNGLLYFHTRMENSTDMPYSVDFITFKVVDKKVAKRTAIQEQVLQPLRAYHQVMQVKGKDSEHSVFVLEQFALSEDKQLEVTLYERNGGRTLSFYVGQEDLLLAKKIDNLKLKW